MEPLFTSLSDSAVFIVDDNQNLLEAYKILIASTGAIVYTEFNPQRVVSHIADVLPDIVLMDVQMGMRSGIELCRDLKKSAYTADIPVILMSAVAIKPGDIVAGLSAGAVDYVVKPFDNDEICMRLSTHIELARLRAKDKEQIQLLSDEVSEKTDKLYSRKMQMHRVRSLIEGYHDSLDNILKIPDERDRWNEIMNLKNNIAEDMKSWDVWGELESQFAGINPNYKQVLFSQFPQLTANEVRICMLIRVGHSSKEIAQLMRISSVSVDTYRSRIRKKIRCEDGNLYDFLQKILP